MVLAVCGSVAHAGAFRDVDCSLAMFHEAHIATLIDSMQRNFIACDEETKSELHMVMERWELRYKKAFGRDDVGWPTGLESGLDERCGTSLVEMTERFTVLYDSNPIIDFVTGGEPE